MVTELKPIRYIDYKIYNVTPIKNKYGFRVILTLEDNTKRPVQHSGFLRKDEAEKERNKVIGKLENRTYIVYTNVTVEEYMKYWYEFVIKDRLKSVGSIDTYKNCVFNHIITNIGNLKLIDLRKGHIKKLYQQIFDYSPSVARILQTVLNTALKDAEIKKFIPTNVAKGVKLPSKEDKKIKTKEESYDSYHTLKIDERKTYKLDEIVKLIKASKSTPIYLQILFAVLMGMRKSEINGVKYADIDYIHRKLYVQRQLGRKKGIKKEEVALKTFTKQEVQLKSKSSYRVLDIPDLVFEEILEQRKKYEERRRRRKNDKNNPFQDLDFICCSIYGRPRSSGYVFQHFKKLKQDNNLPDLPFHKLRTTYTTILTKNDFSMKAISTLLGHSSTMITFENYTDKNEIIQDCLEELEPFIERVIEIGQNEIIDCSDIETDKIMQEYYMSLVA